jgi:translation initiation factor 2B subunit (eIF-2B alpha/beta/delta family)
VEASHGDIVEHLRGGDIVAFVGAGASRTYTDPSGRTHTGLPTASECVAALGSKPYIDAGMPFTEAFFLFKRHSGRAALEQFFVDRMARRGSTPLPAHTLLASLPFLSYITTNYDRLLEGALSEERRNPTAVIEDIDVPRLRLGATAVIKMHGCVSRPASIIAAADEYVLSPSKSPVIDALVRVTLAHKVALFVGYGLADHDFIAIQDWIDVHLGPHRPSGYALVAEASEFQKEYWKSRGITLIVGDLTSFLRDLLRATAQTATSALHHGDDWINSIFFESLQRVRSLPTETDVIDAFLAHLLHELASPNYDLEVVLARAEDAMETVLRARPNYETLRRLSEALVGEIQARCTDKDCAEEVVKDLLESRRQLSVRISRNGNRVVIRNDNILLYSQSKRVGQLLRGVATGIQETCHLYIAECRPKSPEPFQDAIAFAEALSGTSYRVTIVPDVVAANLLRRHQITKVLMGAHQVFRRSGRWESFVNTCGSDAVIEIASRENVKVYIIAEKDKITDLEPDAPPPAISYDEEEALFSSVSSELGELRARGQNVAGINVGYDICEVRGDVEIVTD